MGHEVVDSRRVHDIGERYRAALASLGQTALTEFDLTGYDRVGIPVRGAVWDGDDRTDAHGVGYGTTTTAATVGALGEIAERVLMRDALVGTTPITATYDELLAAHGDRAVADPVALVLDAGADYTPDRPLAWVSATRWPSGEQVLVPREFVLSSPERATDGLINPVTNGLGAGDTLERAISHGLLELIQRDGDNVRFRALDRGVVIDLDTCGDATVREVRATLRRAGIEPVVKLASSELACVVYCIGHDNDPDVPPMALSAIGEGAHPDRDVAIAKAMLEFASSRARRVFAFGPPAGVAERNPDYFAAELRRPIAEQEPRALDAMREWTTWDAATMRTALAPMFTTTRQVSAEQLPTSRVRDPQGLLDLLSARVTDVLYVSNEVDGVHAAKVISPGLEVETMSYLRIGARAAADLLDLDLGLVGTGAADTPSRLPVHLCVEDEHRLGGPVWIDRAAVDRVVGPLYPLYREPRRHAIGRTT